MEYIIKLLSFYKEKIKMFHVKQFEKLEKFCMENNLLYSDEIDQQFANFYEYLIEKNKVMNLTTVTDKSEVEIKHFIDSAEAAAFIQKYTANISEPSVVDIGTGAGFPGIPLKILLPDIHFTLADALNKRISFLNEVIEINHLKKISAIQGRAEDIGQSKLRESFDICVSRAVADMSVLLEYCLPLVKVGGHVILYKSGEFKEELENAAYALDLLGGELKECVEFNLPESSISRSLIILYKGKAAPEKYPRRSGKPSKSPITNK